MMHCSFLIVLDTAVYLPIRVCRGGSALRPALASELLFRAKVDATSKDLLNVFIKVFSIHGTGAYSTSLSHYAPSAFIQGGASLCTQKTLTKSNTLRNTFALKHKIHPTEQCLRLDSRLGRIC